MLHQISTRFLLEVSMESGRYELEFSANKYEFVKAFENNTRDIYIIDTVGSETMKDRQGMNVYSLGMKKLKGKEEPVEALSVEWK